MPSMEEARGTQGTPLSADLAAGLGAISYDGTVTFTQYIKVVLPVDGSVFWVRHDLVGQSALLNAAAFNRYTLGSHVSITVPTPYVVAKGSLHYATDLRQEESETYSINRVVFTTTEELVDLNQVGPRLLYIAEVHGMKFAFSTRGSYYRQSRLYHYRGAAVYSDMATQVVDDMAGFDSVNVVVSNSLPAWLSLNGYVPIYNTFGNPEITLYPSYAVPQNLQSTEPFAAVHIPPESTTALQTTQGVDSTSSLDQLCSDRVRVTLYGVRNRDALNFVACVNQYSLDYNLFGLMNAPVVRDEKRGQVELDALAMKKTVDFEVSYHQSAMNDLARQLITSAVPNFILE